MAPDPSSEKPALTSAEYSRLTTLLGEAGPIAAEIVPDIPAKPGYVAPTERLPGRYTQQPIRDIDAGTVEGSLPQLDRVLAVVHDVAVLAFQCWVDRLAGRSAESHEENKAIAQFVTERAVSFGLGLYFEREGVLRRVTLYAREMPEKAKLSESLRRAGKIVVMAVDDASDPEGTAAFRNSYQMSALSIFPPLVVARTAAEARAIAQKRTGDSAAAREEPTEVGRPNS